MELTEVTRWSDAPATQLAAVRAACTGADGQDPLDEAARMELTHRGLQRSRLWLAGSLDDMSDRMADAHGFALLRPGTGDVPELELAVAPAVRARGVGGSLLQAVRDARPGAVTAWSHGDHPAAARLAGRTGLARVRELWVMRRPVPPDEHAGSGAALPALEERADVRIERFPGEAAPEELADSAVARELLAVNAAAFADHPEQGAMDERNLRERMSEDWFDAAGLLLARDAATGRLLGFHWTKQASPDRGEVYVVGVDPRDQGRGLGRLLTLAGLHHLAGRGVSEIELYVESDNAAAIATYHGLGFTHDPADTHARYAG